MKINEFHWENYIMKIKDKNYHPMLMEITENLPPNLSSFPNLLVYGPNQSGKYSQALNIINKYSNSNCTKYLHCCHYIISFHVKISYYAF